MDKELIDYLKTTFEYGYSEYSGSRDESTIVHNMYHGRQYTDHQLALLADRGQPSEIFNIIRLYARQIIGYYSTTVNTIRATPVQEQDIPIAGVINDITKYIDRTNYWGIEGDKLKLDLILTGLMCSHTTNVEKKNKYGNIERDEFGRKLYTVTKVHIPAEQVVIDPKSNLADTTDSRFTHVFKWLTAKQLKDLFSDTIPKDNITAFNDFLSIEESDINYKNISGWTIGNYTHLEEFLVVHSIIVEDNKILSIFWSGDIILHKEEVIQNPYTVVTLHDSNKTEYYGIFRDVIESQHALNQAIIQIQLMSNSNKVLVTPNSVADFDKFKKAYQRVNAIVQVNNIQGIKIENMDGEIRQQYIIIDNALDRIQKVLGINDSFLGMAYSADSGRKVKLQQNATIMALRYINSKLELFYRLEGWKTINLIQKYYRAVQVLRVSDESTGDRWVEINKPLQDPETGEYFYDTAIDPVTGKPLLDDYGMELSVPINHPETDIEFSNIDIELDVVSYNDEDEKNQLMLETLLSGTIGNALMTVNPKGFMEASALTIKSMKSKHSLDIARILEETAVMLSPQPEKQDTLGSGATKQPLSSTLKLPQNTNEGV